MFGTFKILSRKPIAPKPWIDPGTGLAVITTYHPSSKGMKLRVMGQGEPQIRVTLPYSATLAMAKQFVKTHQGWILNQINKIPKVTTFQSGRDIILLGEPFTLHHTISKRCTLWVDKGIIRITGPEDKWPLYFKNWMVGQVRDFVTKEALQHASSLVTQFQRISLKDTTSQWGSCSAEGNLSFSWRLIFAPREVARYVVIHEVCHLLEMNHSPAFWNLVKSLDPHFQKHRKWLKQHGKKLHAYK